MNPAAERVRNLVAQLGLSRSGAAQLLRSVADELDRGPADTHLREVAEREAERLRAQGFTVAGERLEVRTIAAAALLGCSTGTLRNWRAADTGPHSRVERGVAKYSVYDLVVWRAAESVIPRHEFSPGAVSA